MYPNLEDLADHEGDQIGDDSQNLEVVQSPCPEGPRRNLILSQ